MKYLISLLCYVLFINSSFTQDDKNPRKASYNEINTLINGGTKMHEEQLVKFDKSNVITAPKQEDLIKIHKVKTKTEISKEDDEMTITHYSTSGEILKVITRYLGVTKETDYSYEYDNLGNVILEKATKKDDGSTVTTHYTYNDQNKVIICKKTYSDGDVSYTNTYYDDITNSYIEENNLGVDKFFLNELGLRVHFLAYDDDYKVMGFATSTYNEKGLKISEESSMMGLKMKDTFTYNEKGQLLKAYRKTLIEATWEYTYDERGLETSYKNKNPSLTSSYIYVYEFY
jgi:hypothetical protein